MNVYGALAMRHWERYAPSRVAAMSDREGFFTDLGVQVETQVAALADRLAGSPPVGETYPATVGRLMNARMQAEEIVLGELVWVEAPERSLVEARQEWEANRPSDSSLVRWAERIQESPETEPATVEVEQLADEWALTPEFFFGLLASPIPSQFLAERSGELAEAANIRFLRAQT